VTGFHISGAEFSGSFTTGSELFMDLLMKLRASN
jgi:hypothetical protein